MKKLKCFTLILFSIFTLTSFGQMLAPEDPGGDPVTEEPLGGGAPISSGLSILLSLAVVYGGKKVIELKKENN